ncbi:hypothetical protein D3C84_952270 [compost metagenome]
MIMPLTLEQAIVISAYTGFLVAPNFGLVHEAIEKKLGRPVWTHEIPATHDEIREAFKDDFLSLVPQELNQ